MTELPGLQFRVTGPAGSKTVSVASGSTFLDLKEAIRTAHNITTTDFEILAGYPTSSPLLLPLNEPLTISTKTCGVLKLKLPSAAPMQPHPASVFRAPSHNVGGKLNLSDPPPGTDPEVWAALGEDMRREIILDGLGDGEEDEEEDEGSFAAPFGATAPASAPTSAPASAPASRGFGARIAGLNSSSTASISSNQIGGGVRPFGGGVPLGSRVGRVNNSDDCDCDDDHDN
jgi:hypothetical protein